MSDLYELWDLETANLIGTYESEHAALEDVANAVLIHGRQAVETLLLGREDADGESHLIAEGAALVDRALSQVEPAVGLVVGERRPRQ